MLTVMEDRRQPVAWGLLLIPAVPQFLLHLLTNGRYGIFRDEYYYLACAAHPAWGYVDQPPLSVWILSIRTFVCDDARISRRGSRKSSPRANKSPPTPSNPN
jgi:hypothetical protein